MANRSPYARLLAAAVAAWGAGHAGTPFVGGPAPRFAGRAGWRLPLRAAPGEVAAVPQEAARAPKLRSPYNADASALNIALQSLYGRPLTKGETSFSMPPLRDAVRELLGREPGTGDIHLRYEVTVVGLGGEGNQQAFLGPFATSDEEAASGAAKEAAAWLGLGPPEVTDLQGLATMLHATWGNTTQVWARIGEVTLEVPGQEGRQTYPYLGLVQAAVEAKKQAKKQATGTAPQAKEDATRVKKAVKAETTIVVNRDPEEARLEKALASLFETRVPPGTDLWKGDYFHYAAQVWLKRTMRTGDRAVRGKLIIRNESSDTAEVYITAFTENFSKARELAAHMFFQVQGLRDPGWLPRNATADVHERLAEYIALKTELSSEFRLAEIRLKPDEGEPVIFDPVGLIEAAADIVRHAKKGTSEGLGQGASAVPATKRKKTAPKPAADKAKAKAKAAVHAAAVPVS